MKNFLLSVMCLFGAYTIVAQTSPFITSWTLTSDQDTIEIIPNTNHSYDFSYEWKNSDGTTISSGTHTSSDGVFKTGFATAGTYTLEITGAFPHFTGYPKGKLTDVLQWGDIEWKNFSGAFKDWKGAGFSTSDVPNLQNVKNFGEIFRGASNFNGDISSWDVSNITSIAMAFEDAKKFNQDLSSWDVSKIDFFARIFRKCH